ncbi:MAG TPA: ABC transporter permease [Terriglobales bacterium]|nr:ABC transporter permease [Terriglobales bacterium]
MDFSAAFLLAIRALARNKLRSSLTMLGIIIGVGAVIAVVGIGQGAAAKAQEQLAALGSNMLFVGSGSVNRYGLNVGSGQTKSLVLADAKAIARECPSVSAAAPGTGTGQQVVYGNQNWATQINGTEPQYFEVRNWPFASGTSFGEDDVTQSATVAVLGDTVRRYLFGSSNPVGETIRIGTLPFKVVGVLAPKGTSPGSGQDQDDVIFAPLTTVQKKLLGQEWLRWIMVSAVSRDASYVAQHQIESLLRDRHKIRPGDPDDFVVRNLADVADAAAEQGSVMTILLTIVASVALLVGGIGIMNIMLVSVTERTREIGLRLAVGATEEDVRKQFLIEAMFLGLIGGALGIAFGIASSLVVSRALEWPILIPTYVVVVSPLFAIAIGTIFGFYPARKASQLNPIEALRYE